jgi:hypothetical protein
MAENIFAPIISKLVDVGFYDFLLFLFSLAIFYALLKKSKILGESNMMNGLVAFVGAFLVFGYPILIGISLTVPLTAFFTQALVWIILIFFGLIVASLFYPDLPKMLADQFTKRTTLYEMIAIGISLLITSTLITVLWQGVGGGTAGIPGVPSPPQDVTLIAAGVIIFIVIILIGASTVREG